MKCFISILFVQTNSISREKIAIGLFAISGTEVFFHYSQEKMGMIKKYYLNVYKQALFSIKLIENRLENVDSGVVSELHEGKKSAFSEESILYLNKYSKGVLQFDAPKPYAGILADDTFKNIFESFIGPWGRTKLLHRKMQIHEI